MLHLWEELWLVLFIPYMLQIPVKKPVEYWRPFSKQLNLFLKQLITLNLSYYNDYFTLVFPKKNSSPFLYYIAASAFNCCWNRKDGPREILFTSSFFAAIDSLVLPRDLCRWCFWFNVSSCFQTTTLKRNLSGQVCDLHWCA